MANQTKLVGFFVFLGLLLAALPLAIVGGFFHARKKNKQRLHHDLESSPDRSRWVRRSNTKDFEMLLTGRRNAMGVQNPDKAKVNEPTQGKLASTTKPSSSTPGNPYSARVTHLEEFPDTTLASAASAGPGIGRSDTQKTYSSTASTIVGTRRMRAASMVTDEMRRESIATAAISPLQTIKPDADGYFRPSSDLGSTPYNQATTATRSMISGQSSSARSRTLTDEYHSERDRSRSKGKAVHKTKARDNLRATNEGEFDEIDLGGVGLSQRAREGIQSNDFAKKR